MILIKKNIFSNKKIKPKFKHKYIRHRICKIHLKTSFNNTFISITDAKGKVQSFFTTGKVGFKGAKRSSIFAAEVVIFQAAKYCLMNKIFHAILYIKGIGNARNFVAKILGTCQINLMAIYDITPKPFNGCPLPKKRRT